MPLRLWNRKKPELKENDAVTHNSVFAAANIDKMPIPIPIRVGIFCFLPAGEKHHAVALREGGDNAPKQTRKISQERSHLRTRLRRAKGTQEKTKGLTVDHPRTKTIFS